MATVPYGLVLPAARPGNLCLQGCSGDFQEARSFVVDEKLSFRRKCVAQIIKFLVFFPRVGDPALRREGHRTSVMPECCVQFPVRIWRRCPKNLVPPAE